MQDAVDIEEDVELGDLLAAVFLVAPGECVRVGAPEHRKGLVRDGIVAGDDLLRAGCAVAEKGRLPPSADVFVAVEQGGIRIDLFVPIERETLRVTDVMQVGNPVRHQNAGRGTSCVGNA